MKKSNLFIAAFALLIAFSSCEKCDTKCDCPALFPAKFESIVIESSMKGWELYSWPENVDGCKKWHYALLTGTNRLKSYSEVTSDTVLNVTGEKQLKLLLSKFPTNEQILWVGEKWLSNIWGQSGINHGNLKLPFTSVINDIKQHCIVSQLKLSIVP